MNSTKRDELHSLRSAKRAIPAQSNYKYKTCTAQVWHNLQGSNSAPEEQKQGYVRDTHARRSDAHHTVSRRSALTTTRTSTGVRRSLHRSRMLTSLPGLKSKSKASQLTAPHLWRTNPVNWACEMQNGPNPTPDSHARITTPTHAAGTWAGQQGKHAHPSAQE